MSTARSDCPDNGWGLFAWGLLLLRDSLRLGDDGYLLPVRVPSRGYNFNVLGAPARARRNILCEEHGEGEEKKDIPRACRVSR